MSADGSDVAVLQPTRIHSTGDGQGWQPAAAAGLVCFYSSSQQAVVLHGGVTPGMGRSSDVCVGEVSRGDNGAPPALRWQKINPSMSIPPRAFHGAALLTGASGGDRLLLFGGEGNPTSAPAAGPIGPAMMNDLWEVRLQGGRATNLIALSGTSPSPRTHLTVAVLKDPPAPAPKLSAARMKKFGLSTITANRASLGTIKPSGAASGPAAMAAMARAGGGGGGAAAAGGGGVRPPPLNFGGMRSGGGGGGGGGKTSWTVLIIGGRTGTGEGLFGAEDALHVLRLSENGDARWIPSMTFLREAVRKRQQQQRVKGEAQAMIMQGAKALEEASSPPGSPRSEKSAASAAKPAQPTQRGSAFAAAARAAAAETELQAACMAGKAGFSLLQRSRHTTVVTGTVALLFGGMVRGKASADLISIRFRDLATSVLPVAHGSPPAARHSHAASTGGGGMLVCGGIEAGRIFDDIHLLAIPQLAWSSLRMPNVKPARSLTPTSEMKQQLSLHRHGHAVAPLSFGELLVYGGYAATTTKMGVVSAGGFAPNLACLVMHSTPAAALAAAKMRPQSPDWQGPGGLSPDMLSPDMLSPDSPSVAAALAASAPVPSLTASRGQSPTPSCSSSTRVSVRSSKVTLAAPASREAAGGAPPHRATPSPPPHPAAQSSPSPSQPLIHKQPPPPPPQQHHQQQRQLRSSADEGQGPSAEENSSLSFQAATANVRSIVNHIAGISAGYATEEPTTGGESPPGSPRLGEETSEEEDDDDLDAAARAAGVMDTRTAAERAADEANEVGRLEHRVTEVTTSLAWLREEETRRREELQDLARQADEEDALRVGFEEEVDEANAHVDHLQAHIAARTRAGVHARATLEQSHLVTAQQIQQTLSAVERMLISEVCCCCC